MSKYLDKAVNSISTREKIAFGESAVARSFVKALDKNPYLTLGAIGGGAGLLGSLTNKAFDVTSTPVSTQSYKADRALNPGLSGALTRVRSDEIMAKGLAQNATDVINNAINSTLEYMGRSYKKLVSSPKQKATLKSLIDTDEMIREADPEQVATLFKTMVDIAPNMTKHREAVRSFLRQGLAHEGGLDPMTLGELAKAENRLKGIRD